MTLRQFLSSFFGGKVYDEACREALKELWELVKEDGCVMANPLTGQLEPDGWVVYVQYGSWANEFTSDTLLRATQVALETAKALPELTQ